MKQQNLPLPRHRALVIWGVEGYPILYSKIAKWDLEVLSIGYLKISFTFVPDSLILLAVRIGIFYYPLKYQYFLFC